MYRSILSSGLLAFATWAGAQQYVHQVLVLSEGYFDFNTQTQVEPVKLFAYDPVLGTTTEVASLTGARFGTHVQVHEGHIYVGADNMLLKYDADTYALVDQETVQGIRRFDFWNDKLILSRGEVGGLPHYLEVRDKNTLDLDYIVAPADGLEHSGEDVVVVGDKAYIAVNNGFDWGNAVGYVGVLDLVNESYSEVDLGPDGINPENIMVNGNELWTLNNKDFTGSSVSRINLSNGQHELTENLTFGSGCAASEMAQEKIYFMEYAVGHQQRRDPRHAQRHTGHLRHRERPHQQRPLHHHHRFLQHWRALQHGLGRQHDQHRHRGAQSGQAGVGCPGEPERSGQ